MTAAEGSPGPTPGEHAAGEELVAVGEGVEDIGPEARRERGPLALRELVVVDAGLVVPREGGVADVVTDAAQVGAAVEGGDQGLGRDVRVAPEVARSVWNAGPGDAVLIIVSKKSEDPRQDTEAVEDFWPDDD